MQKNSLLTWKANWKHVALKQAILALDRSQDNSVSGITCRAIEVTLSHTANDWLADRENLPTVSEGDVAVPLTMQARIPADMADDLAKIRENIINALPDVTILHTQYLIQLLWTAYLKYLKEKAIATSSSLDRDDVTLPQLMGIITEIMLIDKNSLELAEMRRLAAAWKNRTNN